MPQLEFDLPAVVEVDLGVDHSPPPDSASAASLARIRACGRPVGRVVASGVGRGRHPAGDGDRLARAVQNLMDNAVRHARSRITVTLAEERGAAQLTVGDDGPGVPEADAERIFERFTRLDDARTAGTGGAGLGLAIARGIAARHGGSLVLERSGSVGARFVLRLPRRPIGGDRV